MKFSRGITIVIFSIAIVLIGGFASYLYYYSQAGSYWGVIREKEAPDFTLMDHNGNPITLSQFIGSAVLVFFGYTNCPDICPMTLAVLKSTLEKLPQKDRDKVKVMFISVDPERDTAERLESYVHHFDPAFIGATGTMAQLEHVAQDYGVYWEVEQKDESKAGYLIGHTSTVFLIEPKRRFYLKYPRTKLDAAMIAEDIKRVL
ncbi:MAG: SCO family protein [Candidatus Caldarchaeum sp.]